MVTWRTTWSTVLGRPHTKSNTTRHDKTVCLSFCSVLFCRVLRVKKHYKTPPDTTTTRPHVQCRRAGDENHVISGACAVRFFCFVWWRFVRRRNFEDLRQTWKKRLEASFRLVVSCSMRCASVPFKLMQIALLQTPSAKMSCRVVSCSIRCAAGLMVQWSPPVVFFLVRIKDTRSTSVTWWFT